MKSVTANLLCFFAMLMWAVGFPAAEILLESWGAISLLCIRLFLGSMLLMIVWLSIEGWQPIVSAPWVAGIWVGGTGFGFGSVLLLVGQKMSDPVTPAIAAAMMPIFGAALEVVFDNRKLRFNLIIGILFALVGGYLATGLNLSEGSFGNGALMCMLAVFLFAWATRATTRNFPSLTGLGQTTLTIVGAFVFMLLAYAVAKMSGYAEIHIGSTDGLSIMLLLLFALVSMAIAQLFWIWGAGRLGILLASFHMNAVPFYVMVTLVIVMNQQWQWRQAAGAALVAIGVLLAQYTDVNKKKSIAVS